MAPDFVEPVIGRRFAPTRWLHPGYACGTTDLPDGLILRIRVQTPREKDSACAVGQISGYFSRVLSR
jgi:hypothetical protein